MYSTARGWTRRDVSSRLAVEGLRRVAVEETLEYVHARPGGVPRHGQGLGAERAEHLEGARVRGLLDRDRVTRIEQRAGDQVEALLRAVDDQDVVGPRLEPEAQEVRREILPERRVAARRVVLEQRRTVLADHVVQHAAERLGRAEAAVGHAAGAADEPAGHRPGA